MSSLTGVASAPPSPPPLPHTPPPPISSPQHQHRAFLWRGKHGRIYPLYMSSFFLGLCHSGVCVCVLCYFSWEMRKLPTARCGAFRVESRMSQGGGFSFPFFTKPPAVLLLGDLRLMGMQQGDRRPPAELRDFIVSGLLNLRFPGILHIAPAFQEIQNNTCV